MRYTLGGVDLSLLSRFPMYGGWKNAWYQGYNLPTEVMMRTVYSMLGIRESLTW